MTDFRNKPHMKLRVAVTGEAKTDPEFMEVLREHIAKHNYEVNTSEYPNAGFDLLVPKSQVMNGVNVSRTHFISYPISEKLNHQIKCEAMFFRDELGSSGFYNYYPSAFYLYPRSSISKTNVRLANNVGIIDSGYRGNIVGAFDVIRDTAVINKFDRLLQICAPGLVPIIVELVDDESKLSVTTRGEGGFGSTGGVASYTAV